MTLCKELNLLSKELRATLHEIVLVILEEFKDMFPDELPPGLPPIRGIEHQIDFFLGATLPNRPA